MRGHRFLRRLYTQFPVEFVGGPLTLGPEIMEKREVRQGVFREVEADLIFSVDTAIALRAWLDGKIQECQRLQEIFTAAQNLGRL
jgi:hypothetical protein